MLPPSRPVAVWDLRTDMKTTFLNITQAVDILLVEPKELRRAVVDFPRVKLLYGIPLVASNDPALFDNLIPEVSMTSCVFSVYRNGQHWRTESRLRNHLSWLRKDKEWYDTIAIPRLMMGENEIEVSDTQTLFFHPKGAMPTQRYRILLPKKAA